jgi:hypothetical protein
MNRAERRRQAKLDRTETVERGPNPGQRKIWLAIPTYGATICNATSRSLMHDMMHLIGEGHKVQVFDQIGHADIYSLRAQMCMHFLADPEATDMVMIDSDVAWAGMGLLRLLDHDVDLVAGSYPKRDYPTRFMFRSEVANNTIDVDEASGLAEVWGMPGGFMRIRRQVLEKMIAHYGDDLTALDHDVPGGKTVRLFDPYWWTDDDGNKRVLSEDYAFCQRWRDMGGKVFMDTRIPMAHVGMHAFKGCLGHVLDGEKMQQREDEAA